MHDERVCGCLPLNSPPRFRLAAGQAVPAFYVCFRGNYVISLRPRLLRVLDKAPGW